MKGCLSRQGSQVVTMIHRDDAKSADEKKIGSIKTLQHETTCIAQKLFDFNSSLNGIGKTIFIRLREKELIIFESESALKIL